MRNVVSCVYVKNPEGVFPSYWLIGLRPFGIGSTIIDQKVHYTAESAEQDYFTRIYHHGFTH